MSCRSKQAALDTLLDCLADTPEVTNPKALKREVYAREKLMSTGLGVGFGVPHVRIASVKNLVMAIGINDQELSDYTALDNTPVRVICMIAAHENQHVPYLKALSLLHPLIKNAPARNKLLRAQSSEEAYAIICAHASAHPSLDT